MRFMMIVKHAEKQGPPPKPLMDAIAKLAEEEAKAGTMLGITEKDGHQREALEAMAKLLRRVETAHKTPLRRKR